MKPTLTLVALIALSLSAYGLFGPRSPSPMKRAPLPKIELVATLPKKNFDKSDPIPLSASLVNRTALPVTIALCGFWPNHLVTVLDKNGVEPPLTEMGRRLRTRFTPGSSDSTAWVEVKPGAARALIGDGAGISVDLAELYHLLPGDYRVKVTYQEEPNPKSAIHSNWVPFRVN